MFNIFKKKKKFIDVVADQVLELGDRTISNLELISDNRKQINKLLDNDIEIVQIVNKQQDEIFELQKMVKELHNSINKNEGV